MRIIKVKFELVMPFFMAALVAMNVCGFIARQDILPSAPVPAALPEETLPFMFSIEGLSPAFLHAPEAVEDAAFDRYRDPASREWVITFFTLISGSRDIAEAILINAEIFNISPSLAFALCWEESRYTPRAVNRRNLNGSMDRGLFQLNSRTFPALTEADFFNPRTNARYGLSHLRWCLDSGGSEIAALAIYNAGTSRVSITGTPKHTLDYVSRILASRQKIDTLFRAEIAHAQEQLPGSELGIAPDIGEGTKLADAPKMNDVKDGIEWSRFAPLSPLSGR
ncbi:hypothetical protein FACS1894140_3810 [Spirochaetia bacterium]|nr:hypothetical protein FACS1894140_3810 [Spirochaetia bacterium]